MLFFKSGPADIFSAWVGAILFSFQIYFDFSGYSDIALGSAYLLGFRLPLNFRQPYLSLNPQDFWVRWHITLSTWIRDYLYIPLGGSRKGGNTRQLLILMVTMMLAGLWHGANWTFIFWGALWGLYIALWRWFGPIKHMLGKLTWLPHIIIVVVLWVVFRSDSITSASEFLKGMIGMHYGAYSFSTNTRDSVLIVIGLMSLFGLHCLEGKFSGSRWIMRFRKFNKPLIYGLAVGLIFWLILLPKSGNPFIYFRF
jgi:D-alanyl-lipoteichoic acid acyltransferase DltB (MBOAT superfamily)